MMFVAAEAPVLREMRIPRGSCAAEPVIVEITEPESHHNILIEEDASLEMICIQRCDSLRSFAINQKFTLGTNASLHLVNVTLGDGDATHNLIAHVQGEGSTSNIDWIFYGKDGDRQHLSARNLFDAPGGSGEITVHGVAEGKAHCSFNGMIEITEKGAGTNAYLTEKTLMLDHTAKVDAVPALEIKTNDVRASHSATVTKVSTDDLFYFASRGIPEGAARKMFVEGFLGVLAENIGDENLQKLVLMEIARKYSRA